MGGAVMKPFKAVQGFFGDMLGFGKMKAPPPPPPPPTIDEAAERQNASDEARRKRGRAASVLTSPTGVGSTPVGTKTLLGG